MTASILGTGHYVPGDPISNEELVDRYGLRIKPYFIRRSVGVETRYFASPDQATSDLATMAALRAIEASGISRGEIRRIILATVSGDYPTPATACIVQRNLGLRGSAAMDVVGACSGFLQAMDLGFRSVATGTGPVLVIGADIRSRQLDFSDLRTVFLYGDGAGAAVLAPDEADRGVLFSVLMADGEGAESVYIPAGGSREPIDERNAGDGRSRITMPNGRLVAERARSGFGELFRQLEESTGATPADLDFVLLHQPNLPLVRTVLQDLGIPETRTWINFPRYANTTSATVPIALSEAVKAGRLGDGDLVALAAVGAGFAGGLQLIRWRAP